MSLPHEILAYMIRQAPHPVTTQDLRRVFPTRDASYLSSCCTRLVASRYIERLGYGRFVARQTLVAAAMAQEERAL